jgi:hypothetical protein
MHIWYEFEFADGNGGFVIYKKLLNWPLQENEEENSLIELRSTHGLPVIPGHLPRFNSVGRPF